MDDIVLICCPTSEKCRFTVVDRMTSYASRVINTCLQSTLASPQAWYRRSRSGYDVVRHPSSCPNGYEKNLPRFIFRKKALMATAVLCLDPYVLRSNPFILLIPRTTSSNACVMLLFVGSAGTGARVRLLPLSSPSSPPVSLPSQPAVKSDDKPRVI
eukprot:CAMPEP_0181028532 /NCGR_PEP_ID=MMETSP1070-20121207/4718_1 /TAXON_ID=265543 /ORGANISM="Minutocellus polymorphus, Strain NH13" /LENGTH=156 /DNA_ID=CAMNT_0023105787 /DNA_START=298 /DNA_END=768 /DNA_ORIENTATION=+